MRNIDFKVKEEPDLKFTISTGKITDEDHKLNAQQVTSTNVKTEYSKRINIHSHKIKQYFKISPKNKIVVGLISALFLIIICWIITYKVFQFRLTFLYKEKQKYQTINPTVEQPYLLENPFYNIYLFVNNLDFLIENYQKLKYEDLYSYDNNQEPETKYLNDDDFFDLTQIRIEESLSKAFKMGITVIVIAESSIDANNSLFLRVLKEFVEQAKEYNVTISLLLDEQFSVPFDIRFAVDRDMFALGSLKRPLVSKKGYILNPLSKVVKDFIEDRMRKFITSGIRSFIAYENPLLLVHKNNVSNLYPFGNKIDFKLLTERSQFILSSAENIQLFYIYENEEDHEQIIENELEYFGALYKIGWRSLENCDFNSDIFSKMFNRNEGENKILMFDFSFHEDEYKFMEVLIGIYLFSPIPIILKIEERFWNFFFQDILTNRRSRIQNTLLKVNTAFKFVLHILKTDPFFRQRSELVEEIKLVNGVITAVRGTIFNQKIHQLLFLLYYKSDGEIYIDLKDTFKDYSFGTYTILFDNLALSGANTYVVSIKIKLLYQQIMVIRPHTDF